jgi:hypothetical protein
MRRWSAFVITLVLGSVLSAVVGGPLTVPRVLAQALRFAALFGSASLAPRRYAEWVTGCRLRVFAGRHRRNLPPGSSVRTVQRTPFLRGASA